MSGYLGSVPVPQATQHRESFTCTEGQTSFATAGYTAQFVDVYLNGSHLSPADFTATNGSDVVLAVAASADDVCDIISYTPFEVADQTFTGTTTMTDVVAASLDISGNIDIDGTTNLDIVDIDGAVNIATTALVTGILTTTAATVFNGGFASNAVSTITTADNSSQLKLISTDADANRGPVLELSRDNSSAADSDRIGSVIFTADDDANNQTEYASITGFIQDASNTTEDAGIIFDTATGGNPAIEKLRLGTLEAVFNEDSVNNLDFRVESNGNTHMLYVYGASDQVAIGTGNLNDDSNPAALTIGKTNHAIHVAGSSIAANTTGGGFFTSRQKDDGSTGWATIGSWDDGTNRRVYYGGGGWSVEEATAHIFYTGSYDAGSSGAGNAFSMSATEAVFNDNGDSSRNFRVETDTFGHAFFVKADDEVINFFSAAVINASSGVIGPDGVSHYSDGRTDMSRSGGQPLNLRRRTNDGIVIAFYKEASGTTAQVGAIGTIGDQLYIGTNDTGLRFLASSDAIMPVRGDTGASVNDVIDLGIDSARFDNIFATNGTIDTSDQNEKQDIAALTSAEMLVAKRISALFKTFKWKARVADKGDAARTHSGIIAQDVQAAFEAESLDAGNYALFTSGSWWEHDVDVAAVEANEEKGIEAADAYTRTDEYYTEDEAPSGSTKRTRLGIRYTKLLSFLAAYNEQRFAAIETRLTALEG